MIFNIIVLMRIIKYISIITKYSMVGLLIYLLFCMEVLAEEFKTLDLDTQIKIVEFLDLFTKYLIKIDLSIEDQHLFCEALKRNKKILAKLLQHLNTTEELDNHAKLIIDNALKDRNRVLYFVERGFWFLFVALCEYCDALHAKTILLIELPKKTLLEVLSSLWEKIIKIIFGLP